MLFASWEIRIVKNCDGGLENAARGHTLRAAFSSQFDFSSQTLSIFKSEVTVFHFMDRP